MPTIRRPFLLRRRRRGYDFRNVAIRDNLHSIVVVVHDAGSAGWPSRNLVRLFYANFRAVVEMDFQWLKRLAIHQLNHSVRGHRSLKSEWLYDYSTTCGMFDESASWKTECLYHC